MAEVDARRRRIARRAALAWGLGACVGGAAGQPQAERRFQLAAEVMKELAVGWGDQPYGAVLVLGDRIVGEGPSRVVKNGNPDAHAEREAIRDARARLGRDRLEGSTLYSTSRPCRLCEQAAAAAGVARMVFGVDMQDAGRPRP